MAYIDEYFQLTDQSLYGRKARFGYNGFGEFVFRRTYSRQKFNGKQESWADVVYRVINGVMSIRKDFYVKNHIEWDESRWQDYGSRMAIHMFDMKWMPPGRGLWVMGTNFLTERGSMAAYNCAMTALGSNDRLANDLHWLMDCLMLGVGVGFAPLRDDLKVHKPQNQYNYDIDDTRESWCDSVKLLVNAYLKPNSPKPNFGYDLIRKKGLLIKGFGGLSSGPGPLIQLHENINRVFTTPNLSPVRIKTDLANMIGVCVVAGNVRRSAEIAIAPVSDREFMDLKDYTKYPEREAYGWLSNNTCSFEYDEDYEMMGEVAKSVLVRGEPGAMNKRNFKYGRYGKIDVRPDNAIGLNP